MLPKLLVALCVILSIRVKEYEGLSVLRSDAPSNTIDDDSEQDARLRSTARIRRYLGLNKLYKINKRYQECFAPGDVPGHCKHAPYCSLDVVASSKRPLDYLCVITETHVGVCCPDDLLQSKIAGSMVIMDLPAGGLDYDDDETTSTAGCGILPDSNFQINGTNKSRALEWPWLAVLYRPKGAQLQFCGGAVITDQHILTAAHCVNNMVKEDFRVRLGEYDFRRVNETRARDFGVADVVIHKEFEPATYFNDIAILMLDQKTVFDSYVWPICLPPMTGEYVNKTAVVAGWGQRYYAGPTSELLLQVEVPVWNFEKCVDAFAQRITENNICAAAYEGGKDACLGDSGGPLLHKLDNGRWTTIGIVSWGIGCGNVGQPGIYLRVDKYLPWIITNTITKTLVKLP